jgi:hypothetical protein
MATLAQIRDGVQSGPRGGDPGPVGVPARGLGVRTRRRWSMVPAEVDYDLVMKRSTMRWDLDLYVMTSAAVNSLGQLDLDELIDIDGARSIPSALFDEDLNLPSTHAHVASMSGYGGDWLSAGTEYIGAILRLVVITKGAP